MALDRSPAVVLVLANICWALFCAITALMVAPRASYYGLAHLILEGAYVGGLGFLEWKQRSALETAA